MLASRSGFLVISIGMWIFVYRLILREETTLLQSQGESYRRYLAAVPRLLPSLTPRVPASGAKANWLDGFTGELFMWGGAAAMAVFTAHAEHPVFLDCLWSRHGDLLPAELRPQSWQTHLGFAGRHSWEKGFCRVLSYLFVSRTAWLCGRRLRFVLRFRPDESLFQPPALGGMRARHLERLFDHLNG